MTATPIAGRELRVFTTRPDTLYGATYMVLSPEHPLVDEITTPEQRAAVEAYQERGARARATSSAPISPKDKTGVFTGAYAINPVNGEQIPIWIADYVLASYGTGAIMAVPAHDERDHEFAKKFGMPDRARWSRPRTAAPSEPSKAFTGDGVAMNSGRSTACPRPRPRRRSPPSWRRAALGKGASATGCATGCSRASATGASRSRSSTAATDGVVPVPEEQLPVRCPRSSATSRPAPASRRSRRSRAS